MNAKIKNFYFNNTNHGGNSGKKMIGEHFKPVMNMIIQHVMWMTGLGHKFCQGEPVMNTGLGIKDDAMDKELNDEEAAANEAAEEYDGEEQVGLYEDPEEEEQQSQMTATTTNLNPGTLEQSTNNSA